MQIFVMTGAGISAPSGIPSFRDKGGLWSKYDVDTVASSTGLARNPEKVNEFFDLLWEEYKDKLPNPAHVALKDLEQVRDVFIATQNVDSLHEKAGSKNVFHAHGRIDTIITPEGERKLRDHGFQAARPDIVLFGEEIYNEAEIYKAAINADELWIVGTEGVVYPFMHYATIARRQAKKFQKPFAIRFFNNKETDFESDFGRSFTSREKVFSYRGDVSETLPSVVEKIINVKKGYIF